MRSPSWPVRGCYGDGGWAGVGGCAWGADLLYVCLRVAVPPADVLQLPRASCQLLQPPSSASLTERATAHASIIIHAHTSQHCNTTNSSLDSINHIYLSCGDRRQSLKSNPSHIFIYYNYTFILFNILLEDIFIPSTVVEREQIMMGIWIIVWIRTQVSCISKIAQGVNTKTQNRRTDFHLICECEFEVSPQPTGHLV